eukprot:TRINITY_DN20659_c0_g1_i2.p1 TRINITY_DN20659_c0_g1~~TRINITY_DN20659_c0_g1_i2.p1  ORF type:complete len:687 (+),score=119.69 TRINITY_DN20659_c0_g1_i2:125-2185(+)
MEVVGPRASLGGPLNGGGADPKTRLVNGNGVHLSGGPDGAGIVKESSDPLLSARTKDDFKYADDFNSNRFHCIMNPPRAMETLGPWGRLELEVIRAIDLCPADAALFEPNSNSAVKVFLDDIMVYQTPAVRSLNPHWKHAGNVFVTAPASMVRLQVVDTSSSAAGIGFVEFSMKEMPIGKPVEGFMELRFIENLQKTSDVRYGQHRTTREDSLYRTAYSEELKPESSADKLINDSFVKTHKQRGRRLLACCNGTSTKSPAGSPTSRSINHLNAGELYVRMTLTPLKSSWDPVFALSLDPPAPENFGTFITQDNVPQLSAQTLYDDAQHVKLMVYDDFIMCLANWVRYIVYWRCFLVSAILTALFCMTCYQTWFFPAVCPGLMAIALFCNGFESIRNAMSIAGSNAPLTDDGFQRVALLRSTPQMLFWATRLVQDLGGSVQDQQKFRVLVSRCFRYGKPLLTIDEFRTRLQSEECIKINKTDLAVGTLVLVNERKLATITGFQGTKVNVHFDTIDANNQRAAPEWVERHTVQPRAVMPNVPGVFIPAKVDLQIRTFQMTLESVKLKMVPKLRKLADIVTWRNYAVSMIIFIALTACSVFGSILYYQHEHASQKGEEVSELHAIAMRVVENLDNTCVVLAGLAVMLPHADWFVAFKAMFRILARWRSWKRNAPACWAFYRKAAEGEEP